GYFSNGLIVTYMEMYLVNQTNPSGEIIDETNPIRSDQNITIRFDVTNIGGTISSVWIIVWKTVASAGNILWQGVMSLIGGIWQVQVPVNASYPAYVNYTVFANDTANRTTQAEGNFITFGKNISACGILNSANTTYYLTNNITSVLTCLNVTANNVTIDGKGYWITYGTAGTDYTYGIVVDNFNFTVIKNARITEYETTGSYRYGIYFNKASNGSISNSMINTSGTSSYGIYLFTRSNFNSIFNNTINTSANYANNIYINLNSNSNNIANNTISGQGSVMAGVQMASSSLNTLYNNSITVTGTSNSYGVSDAADSNNIINNIIKTSSTENVAGPGIYVQGNTNNVTGNIVTTIRDYGIEIYQGTLNNISNNQVNSSRSNSYTIYGTTIAHHNNTIGPDNLAEGKPVNYTFNAANLVINNTDYTRYGEVMFGYSRNITIMNSNFSNDGLNLFNTSISNISNNMINTSKGYGILLLSSSDFNNITNNVINTSEKYGHGIYLSTNPKGNIIDGNKVNVFSKGNLGDCILLDSSTDNIIERNQLQNPNGQGKVIEIISDSSRNLITNNSMMSLYGSGVYLESSSNNAFVDNDITTNYAYSSGFSLNWDVTNITIDRLRVKATGSALEVNGVVNFTLSNSILNVTNETTGAALILSEWEAGGIWNFTNVTFNHSRIAWTEVATGTLNVKWYLDAYANYSDGSPAAGAHISAWYNKTSPIFDAVTDSNGVIPHQALMGYSQNGSDAATNINYYSNYTFNASSPPYINLSQELDMSTNRHIFFTFIKPAVVNQTNPSGQIVNATNTIFANQNLTIRVNATGIGETISTVWIIVWQTVASAGNILWQGLMSLIGGLWQVQVPVNESYPTYANYTVFVNDSTNHTVQTEGNFIVNGISLTGCRELSQANTTYILASNVSSDNTCFNITAWNVTLDCRGYTIDFANSKTDEGYGFGVISYENDTTIKNCNISRDSNIGRYACGIFLLNSS
ncbi:MAG: right-handed parallel beta-helix repeat-containing protein, partial [Candidatus Woesearchaeota archaeon]|nr:right-handed parallel beta-helix repeat-containing protein [Candidatus Woesearchaeota archaeon]